MIALAVAAALAAQPAGTAPAAADPAAEIARLEQQWGEAFVARDFDFIERIVAPEYKLVGGGVEVPHSVTERSDWMKNARAFTHHGFEVKTVDVTLAGDTAVASAEGLWTVTFRPGMGPMPVRFFVTDTWVRRNGHWQVIHRYSHAPRPAPAAAAPGR